MVRWLPQPDAYTRQHDFEEFQSSNPTTPLPATWVENELDAVKHSLDETQDALELIQGDGGALRAGIVTPDSLSASTLALLTISGATIRGDWATATEYAEGDVAAVDESGAPAGTYIAAEDHTSGTFSTDLAAGKWVVLAQSEAVSFPITVAQGGTNAATASAARTNLGAAARGENSDIEELTGLLVPLSVDQGGTGADTGAGARTALGAAAAGANSDITSLSGLTTPLSVAQGGSGVDTAEEALVAFGGAGARNYQVFDAGGTFSKATLPSWVTHVIVEGWSGGGGGGGGRGNDSTRGGGGGGGAYFRKRIAVSALATSETVTIGAGGTGGAQDATTPTAGSTGGTTSFGSHCSATGGAGGPASNGSIQAGVAGGTATGGDINLPGGQSTLSFPDGANGGGGRGGNAAGGGGPGACANVANNGTFPGGGGSAGNHTSGNGGTGGAGLVIVSW